LSELSAMLPLGTWKDDLHTLSNLIGR